MNTLNLPQIIQNDDHLYEGDLVHYFKSIMESAKNLKNPYHNFRHMFHVTWLCYDACKFYQDDKRFTQRNMRNLLIAAMYHDYDHTGRSGNDDLNIELAVRGLTKHIHVVDKMFLPEIIDIIKTTQYPHVKASDELNILAQVLRDADMSQGLSPVWVQEIIFGLSSEMCLSPQSLFKMQTGFFSTLHFSTKWAQEKFPQELIKSKIDEAQAYVKLIEM